MKRVAIIEPEAQVIPYKEITGEEIVAFVSKYQNVFVMVHDPRCELWGFAPLDELIAWIVSDSKCWNYTSRDGAAQAARYAVVSGEEVFVLSGQAR